MKTKIFVGLLGALVVITGCVGTVSGEKTVGTHLAIDKVEGRYARPLDEVFNASKVVIGDMGVLVKEGILHGETNLVKHAEGRINERKVWVRVEAVEPKVTEVTVQARTSGGRADVDLAHQVEKNIALKLVR